MSTFKPWLTPSTRDDIKRFHQCPKLTCKAQPGQPCDFAPDKHLSAADRKGRMAEGISHVERMLVAQGHCERDALMLAAEYRSQGKRHSRHDDAAGRYKPPQPMMLWQTVATLVPCRKHQKRRGEPCTRASVCQSRTKAAAETAGHRKIRNVVQDCDGARAVEDYWVKIIKMEPCSTGTDPEVFRIVGGCGSCVECVGMDDPMVQEEPLPTADVVLASGSNYDEFHQYT
jgi:hypothetical protein